MVRGRGPTEDRYEVDHCFWKVSLLLQRNENNNNYKVAILFMDINV